MIEDSRREGGLGESTHSYGLGCSYTVTRPAGKTAHPGTISAAPEVILDHWRSIWYGCGSLGLAHQVELGARDGSRTRTCTRYFTIVPGYDR